MASPMTGTDSNATSLWQTFVAYFAGPDVAGITTLIGTVASIVGLLFTIWVLFSVSAIRSHFLFAARIPQIIEALQENASAISKGLTEYDASTHLIEVELAKCAANLKNLSTKVKSRTRKSVLAVVIRIEHPGNLTGKDHVRGVYTALNGLIQELHNLTEDMKWSDTNG